MRDNAPQSASQGLPVGHSQFLDLYLCTPCLHNHRIHHSRRLPQCYVNSDKLLDKLARLMHNINRAGNFSRSRGFQLIVPVN